MVRGWWVCLCGASAMRVVCELDLQSPWLRGDRGWRVKQPMSGASCTVQ